MDEAEVPSRSRVVLGAVAGVGLLLLGAATLLWIVYADRLATMRLRPGPGDVGLWAVLRLAAAGALAAGSWLLAVAWLRARARRTRPR